MEKGAAVPSTLKMTTLVKNYVEAEHGLELDSLKALFDEVDSYELFSV